MQRVVDMKHHVVTLALGLFLPLSGCGGKPHAPASIGPAPVAAAPAPNTVEAHDQAYAACTSKCLEQGPIDGAPAGWAGMSSEACTSECQPACGEAGPMPMEAAPPTQP